ncbi:hypothetical protein TWF281_006304 [Arthrobotrys megalospora]
MASLQTLPLELTVLITSYLPLPSLKNLSLCSHHFRAPTLPSIFTNLHVSFNNSSSSLDGFAGSLYHIKSYVKHITISVPSPLGLDVELFFQYVEAVGLSLHTLDKLTSLKILLSSSRHTLDVLEGFDDHVFSLLLHPGDGEDEAKLSHYKTLQTLQIEITSIQEKWTPEVDKFRSELESTRQQMLLRSVDLDSGRFRPPSQLPALREFSVKTDPRHLQETDSEDISGYRMLSHCDSSNILSLLAGSVDSLESLNVWMRIDSYDFGPLIEFPGRLVFPNVKQLRFHSWFLWCDDEDTLEFEGGTHLVTLSQAAPNVEDLALYLEWRLLNSSLTIEGIDRAFSEFKEYGISGLKTVRMGWPRILAMTEEGKMGFYQLVGTEELGDKLLEWSYQGFEKLEKVVFVRIAEGQNDIVDESFEAISATLRMGEDGIKVVEWSEAYTEKLLDMELQDWLDNPIRTF